MRLRARITLTTALVTLPLIGLLVWLDSFAQQRAAERELTDFTLALLARDGQARCEKDPGHWGAQPDPPPAGGPPGPPRPRPSPPREGGPGPATPPTSVQMPPASLPAPSASLQMPSASLPAPPASLPTRREGPGRSRAGVELPQEPFRPHRERARFYVYNAAGEAQTAGAPPFPHAAAASLALGASLSLSPWKVGAAEILLRSPWEGGGCAFVLARGTVEPWHGALLPPTRLWLLPMVLVFAVVLLSIGPAITRLRRLERAVRRAVGHSYDAPIPVEGEDELGDLARAFDAAAVRVRSQMAEKDRREQALRQFLADSTHDVMIPLSALQGQLSALREQLPEEARGEAVAAMDNAHYIAALLRNLSVTARLDVTEPQLQETEVDLGELVTRVTARHRPIARQLGVALESATPEEKLHARADLTLLEQAISNLIYNAIRHNRPGGHVAVVLEPLAEGFSLQVIDDGPGIPAEELSVIAARGYRGNLARTRSPDGQGLGLHIAHRVAALHGLALRFSTPEDGGLSVSLSTVRPG